MKETYFFCVLTLLICFTSTASGAGALASKGFAEGGGKCPLFKPAKNLNKDWVTKIAAWYMPMASAYAYHTWVEKFTNRSAGKDDIANLCLKLLFLASDKPNTPYMVVAGGLGKAVIYRCMAKGPHQQICEGIKGSPGYMPNDGSEETLIATDNTSWALMGKCINKSIMSWFVMTPTQDPLTAEAKATIVKAIQGYGFNVKYGSLISYGKCPKPPPTKAPAKGSAPAQSRSKG